MSKKYIRLEKASLASIEKKVEFGKLAEGLFHDLINPISSLSLHIEKLSALTSDIHQVKNQVENVEDITEKINDFIRNIKIVIDDTKHFHTNRSYEIHQSISLVQSLYAYKLKIHKINFRTRVKLDACLPIYCTRLNQLFMNLISNSIESFAEIDAKRKRYIYICAMKICENQFKIEIHDNGKGMNKKEKKCAFIYPFSTKINGSGIGLMTVAHIVKKEMKGNIKIRSKIGKGTKISILFPINNPIFYPSKTPTEHL